MANGEWRMANGEWRMANGEWRMALQFLFAVARRRLMGAPLKIGVRGFSLALNPKDLASIFIFDGVLHYTTGCLKRETRKLDSVATKNKKENADATAATNFHCILPVKIYTYPCNLRSLFVIVHSPPFSAPEHWNEGREE